MAPNWPPWTPSRTVAPDFDKEREIPVQSGQAATKGRTASAVRTAVKGQRPAPAHSTTQHSTLSSLMRCEKRRRGPSGVAAQHGAWRCGDRTGRHDNQRTKEGSHQECGTHPVLFSSTRTRAPTLQKYSTSSRGPTPTSASALSTRSRTRSFLQSLSGSRASTSRFRGMCCSMSVLSTHPCRSGRFDGGFSRHLLLSCSSSSTGW